MIKKTLKSFIFIVLLLVVEASFSQQIKLNIYGLNDINIPYLDSISPPKKFLSALKVNQALNKLSEKLTLLGYFDHQLKIEKKTGIYDCYYTLNKKIDTIKIVFQPYLKRAIQSISKNKTDTNYILIPVSKVPWILKNISSFYEKQGYSFSSFRLDKITLSSINNHSILNAQLKFNSLKKRVVNKIEIVGYPKFPRKFLKSFQLKLNTTTFNKALLKNIESYLNQLQFINQYKKPATLFTTDSTIVYVYLKRKKASFFDGIIGFSNSDTGNNALKFNGFLNLNLVNTFNKGEQFQLNWKSLQNSNKSLEINLNTPYIFNSKINGAFRFSIFKQDTAFVNTKSNIQFNTLWNKKINLGFIFEQENSNNTLVNANNKIENFNKFYLGGSLTFNTKLTNFNISILSGSIQHNNSSEPQSKYEFFASQNIPFNKRFNFHLEIQSAYLNARKYLSNELYRVGGFNSIRGFDEQSIYTSKFVIFKSSINYLINQNFKLYNITDIGIIENPFFSNDTLLGVGLGFQLITEKQLINLAYAVGKRQNTNFNFRNPFIHLQILIPF